MSRAWKPDRFPYGQGRSHNFVKSEEIRVREALKVKKMQVFCLSNARQVLSQTQEV